MEVSSYIIIITIIGLAALGMAWMPSISKKTNISYSIIYVLFGMLLYIFLGNLLPLPDPISNNNLTLRLTELVVIVSLMGTGLKIDRPFTWRNWTVPFRLVSITMVLSIFLVAFLAVSLLRFDWPSAILLGAVLAPTDPVLAGDVQVGPPLEEKENKVRFSLTAEAGMNDGTAFPFTWLAIVLAAMPLEGSVAHWVSFYFLYKLAAGVIAGYLLGRLLAYLVFKLPARRKDMKTRDGFVALSATLLIYGLTEIVQGYGFIAVFISAITIRNSELHHKYHRKLHDFTDQIERVLVAVVLLLFGGSIVTGVLKTLNWQMMLFAFAFVLLIRPLTSQISMLKDQMHRKEKWAVGFFGIKGMGSFYYLSFALSKRYFPLNEELWALGSFVVLLSIILHGITATPILKKLEVEVAAADAVPVK
ncbi:MAG: cation:proton antiporter [Flavisolibacter sp.]